MLTDGKTIRILLYMILKQAIVQFDTAITALTQRGPQWLQPLMIVASTVGQPIVLVALAIVVITNAWHHHMPLAGSMITCLAAMVACGVLKHFIHRTRPDTLYVSKMYFKTASFPSGHSFGAIVVLGLLAYISAHYMTGLAQIIAPIFLGILIFSIGLSRIYLGAHYPTDVIAGWLLGGFTLVAIILKFSI